MFHNFGVYSFEEMMAEDLENQDDNGESSQALGKSPCSPKESRLMDPPQMFSDCGGVVTEKLDSPHYEIEKHRHVSSGDLQTPERQQSPQWNYTTSENTELQHQAASNQWNETDERELQSLLPRWDDNPTGKEDTQGAEMEQRAASRQWNNTETDEEEIQSLFPLWDNATGTEDTLQHAASTLSNEATGTEKEQLQSLLPKWDNKKRKKERVETEETKQLKMLPEWNEQYDSEEIQRQNWYNHWNEQHRESSHRNDPISDVETTQHMELSQRDDPTAAEVTRQHMESYQRNNTSQTDDVVGLDEATFSFQRLFEQRAGSVPRRREGLPWRADIHSREALQDSREDQSDESRLHELSQWREYTREDSRRRKDLRWLEKSRLRERTRRQEDSGRNEDVRDPENLPQQETYRREIESCGQISAQIELIRVAFSQRLRSDDVELERVE